MAHSEFEPQRQIRNLVRVARDAKINAEAVMTICALRFDGYRWSENGGIAFEDWDARVEAFIRSGSLHADLISNFAVFFRMQRTLCKAGDGFFGQDDDYAQVASRLFLALVDEPTPASYVASDYERQWASLSAAQRTKATTFVQAWLAPK